MLLTNKPAAMLDVSAKGTVPVLVMENGDVLDESWDIVLWATAKNDPRGWRGPHNGHLAAASALVMATDCSFKPWLDKYKYADRHAESSPDYYRQQAAGFLAGLESRLQRFPFLLGDTLSVGDIGVLPFVRQFAAVDTVWFQRSPYSQLQRWLNALVTSTLFTAVMLKYSPWAVGDAPVWFGGSENCERTAGA